MIHREQILAAEDLKRVPIEIPEWGGTFFVRELTGTERGELERRISEQAGAKLLREYHRGLVAIAVLCDELGNRIFTYADMVAVSGKSGKILDRIGKVADDLNKLSEESVEVAAKNSEPSRTEPTA